MPQFLKFWCVVAIALISFAGAAHAFEDYLIGQAERATTEFRTELQRIEGQIGVPTITDQNLVSLRNALEDIRSKALTKSTELSGPIVEVTQQLSKLGPVPVDGATEAPEIEAQRKLLNDALSRLKGAQTQLELVGVEAEQQAGRASSIQRDQFFQRIFESSRSVVNPYLWTDAGTGLTIFFERISALLTNWWKEIRQTASTISLVLAPVLLGLLIGIFLMAYRVLQLRIQIRSQESGFPDNLDRLWRVIRAVLGTTLFAIVAALIGDSFLKGAGLLTPRLALIVNGLADIVFGTLIYGMMAYRTAAPGQPNWRLLNLDDRAARRFALLATICAGMSSASDAFSTLADGIYLPVSYSIGMSALASSVMLSLIVLILLNFRGQTGLAEKSPNQVLYFGWVERFLMPVWLLVFFAALCLLFGFIALANFIVFKLFNTALVVTFLFLVHHTVDELVRRSFDPASDFGKLHRRLSGLGERGIERAGLLFRTAVDVLLILIGLPMLFLLWTLTWIDFRALANKAFFGFEVGSVTISPSSILLVALVLFSGIALTKIFVGWLNTRILSETRIDKGVQDSIRKGATYAGYIFAAGFSLTAAGLEFSNLAIVAGALGVGIGFGLQSIVNNFVSGLILLAERPIRVGDWVSIPAGEGIIKKINVRATEIETFDGCAIIVPNSNLITESVKNWTHSDTMGRFNVVVGVAYDSDVEKVQELLFQITKAHPKVLTYPEPQVTLARFGTYSLDFDIKATVADIFDGIFVASDVRFAILKEFKEKGIVIPQPPLVSIAK